ncbi:MULTISPECIES: SDR family NAD(P)-dependent oxidoreductase [Bradyrhizobium]|uniref:Oxidoreductase n=1 Tax=Bradyrhizobium canariense TaxID=255045 RepID=A0A1X3FYN5_9BRAD|nr:MULTISPECIES: glucose 1-dehydrogenase [Bradyrhizobium]OSI71582.1 oxidoreductase [Bradyrhizobium canariense]OSI80545.1 oxidoreductase [Bradyrhizobium canariense]OSI91147.1 oxidoreductase [Bradyrhizobium canariense]OSI96896.1 oxidoreductase [Bradyrhizobium canariense]OSJ09198.1 oxidoreductase [Bradyrhizobium canariense]
MSRLQGKVAVITGGSSGIGLATAKRFVEEGAYVFITGRRQGELDKAVAEIGRNVTAVRGDATNESDLDALFETVAREKGKLDVLVANSGLIEQVKLEDISAEHFDRTFALNARAPLFTAQKALPLMKGSGSIVLVASIAGYMGFPNHSTYSATKAAVRSYARTWTAEFKDSGLRVNILSPGPIDTPIIDSQADTKEGADKIRAFYASVIPMNRMGRAEEVANAALFLASDESSFVAGVELSVDGGMGAV